MLRNIFLASVSALALSAMCQAQTVATGSQSVTAMASKTAIPSYGFWQSVGINFHAEYDAAAGMAVNPYNDIGKVIDAIKYLDIKTIRASPGGDGFSRLQQVTAATGAKVTFFFTNGWGQTYDSQRALATSVLTGSTNWIKAIEGYNEGDNWGPTLNGQSMIKGSAAGQQMLWSDFANSGVPIYNFSCGNPDSLASVGNMSGDATYSNAHTYPPAGYGASSWLANWLPKSQRDTPGLPFFVQTEAGYSTNGPAQTSFNGSVSERAQARMLLNLLAASYKEGVAETDIYELVDSDATGAACDLNADWREAHFGLFRCDWTPKPSAIALANMNAIIADAKPTGPMGAALNFTVTGIPSYKTLLLERTDGGFILVVWSEPIIFDAGSMQDIVVAPTHGTVAFGETAKTASVFDPLAGADQGGDASVTSGGPPKPSPIATASNVDSIGINVSDHPVFVVINATGVGGTALQTAAMSAFATAIQTASTAGSAGTAVPAGATLAADGSVVFDPIPPSTQAYQSAAPTSSTPLPDGHHRHHRLHHRGGQASTAPTSTAATSTPAASPSVTAVTAPKATAASAALPAATPVAVSTSSGPSITVSPSQDLQAAINGAAPGTTVHVAAGTYAGGLDITASNVTIQADGKVNIVGGSTTSDGDMVTIRGDNTQFVGFDVSGAQSPGAYTLITVLGQGDSIINDTVHDLQTGGLNSWGGAIVAGDGSNASSGANVTISGNTVANVGPPGQTSNLVHGIYAASPGATITGNSISNIDGTAITSWHAASNMTVTGNTIDTAYQGITLGASDGAINQGSTVTGNTITHSPNPIDQEGSFANNTIAENAVQ